MNRFQVKIAGEYLKYKIFKPHKGGHGIHSPFLYSFVQEVLYAPNKTAPTPNSITLLRRKLLRNTQVLQIEDMGAGSAQSAIKERRVKDVARISSVTPHYEPVRNVE